MNCFNNLKKDLLAMDEFYHLALVIKQKYFLTSPTIKYPTTARRACVFCK